jgi:methylthioribose-1-phosphate isomerase
MLKAIEWKQHKLFIVDQTKLPERTVKILCRAPQQVAEAIKTLKIRGASAVGVAAAFAIYLGVKATPLAKTYPKLIAQIDKTKALLKNTQSPDMNLYWAIDRMRNCAESNRDHKLVTLRDILLREAMAIMKEDEKVTQTIANMGSEMIRNGDHILTCGNSGTLSTAGVGTALGMLIQSAGRLQDIHILVGETRPHLHGARLTALELKQAKVPFKLITDNMAAYFMKKGLVNVVAVGASRVAMNGDVAAEMGTYGLAMLAYHHNIPFYVAAPISSFDRSLHNGEQLQVEERRPEEVLNIHGKPISVIGAKAANPSCDITPHKYISALISELGIIRAPFDQNLKNLFSTLV